MRMRLIDLYRHYFVIISIKSSIIKRSYKGYVGAVFAERAISPPRNFGAD